MKTTKEIELKLSKEKELNEKRLGEKGLGMVEVLFSILLVGLAAAGIASHTLTALKISSRLELNHAAHSLALSKAEQISSLNTSSISSADNSVENGLTSGGFNRITFRREVTINTNSDGSRTIEIEVRTENAPETVSSTYTTALAPWE